MATVTDNPPKGNVPAPKRWSSGDGRFFMRLVMLMMGAAGLIYEYIISNVFTNLLGNSVEQFSIVIGVIFFMMGVSGMLQNRLRGALAEQFIATELLLVVLGGFAPSILQATHVLMQDDFAWMKLVYPAIIGFLVGVEIPLIMRINEERFKRNLSENISGTWAWDYIGGAIGVIVWVILLRRSVPLTDISVWVASLNLMAAITAFIFFWRHRLFSWRISVSAIGTTTLVVGLVLTFGASNVDNWTKVLEQKSYDDPVVLSQTTKYQHIVMTKSGHPFIPGESEYELFLNGSKQLNTTDEAKYHEPLVHPAMTLAAQRERVLILGGGDGMALREVLKYPDVKDVTLVDLDPGMIKLARDNPILRQFNHDAFRDARLTTNLNDPSVGGVRDTGKTEELKVETGEYATPECGETASSGSVGYQCTTKKETRRVGKVNVFAVDADQFVKRWQRHYDVVLVDLPDPNSIELAKLYSKEFYTKIRRGMSPDGIVVVQATSPYHAKEAYLCIMRTMTAAGLPVVPFHKNVPSFGDWGWLMASPSLSAETLRERFAAIPAFEAPTSVLTPAGSRAMLEFDKGSFATHNDDISTVMHPAILRYYLTEGWKQE